MPKPFDVLKKHPTPPPIKKKKGGGVGGGWRTNKVAKKKQSKEKKGLQVYIQVHIYWNITEYACEKRHISILHCD